MHDKNIICANVRKCVAVTQISIHDVIVVISFSAISFHAKELSSGFSFFEVKYLQHAVAIDKPIAKI